MKKKEPYVNDIDFREAEMFKYNGSGNSEKHLENVNCYGNERDINRCSNVQWGSSCYRGTSLGLKCCKL